MIVIVEAGKYYKTRDGLRVGPMVYSGGQYKDDVTFQFRSETKERWEGNPQMWKSDGKVWMKTTAIEDCDDLISEWTKTPQGPVRTKTVTEIVPGVYGAILVGVYTDHDVQVRMHMDDAGKRYYATELRAAALVLTQLAEALEE